MRSAECAITAGLRQSRFAHRSATRLECGRRNRWTFFGPFEEHSKTRARRISSERIRSFSAGIKTGSRIMRGSQDMALQPGSTLGPYEVVSRLGAGGMGEVYRARDTRLDRSVAVKVLAPELADRRRLPRTLRTRGQGDLRAQPPAHLRAIRHRPRARHRLSGARITRRGDAGCASERGPLPLSQVLRFGIRDRGRARGGTPAGHRPSGPEAGKRDAHPGGHQASRFRPREEHRGRCRAGALTARDVATDDHGQGTILGTLPVHGARTSAGASRPTRVPTSSRWAPSCTRWPRAGGRSWPRRRRVSLRKFSRRNRLSCRRWHHSLPQPLTTSSRAASRRHPPIGGRRRTTSNCSCSGSRRKAHASTGLTPVAVTRRRTAWVPWVVAGAACALLAATTLLLSSRPVVTQAPPVRFDLVLPPEMRRADYDRGAISPDGQAIRVRSHRGGPQAIGPARPGIHGIGCPGGNGRRLPIRSGPPTAGRSRSSTPRVT